VPDATPPSDLIPLAITALATTDSARDDRRPAAVRRVGARICAGALDVLVGGREARDRSAAARLWSALCPDDRAPRQAQLAALNAALVLLADHELAASTFATRVAASAWADPYRAVLAGLGPLGGALHGGSPRASQALLASIALPTEAAAALERAGADGYVAGFGHRVYVDRDPRSDYLLGRIPAVAGSVTQARTVMAVVDAATSLGLPAPNVDFALAALTYVMDLEPDAATTIFTFARLVGLVAHAMEEYPHRLRFRPRATYRDGSESSRG
jgi:citrate synthase